jgi:hypothetical protein
VSDADRIRPDRSAALDADRIPPDRLAALDADRIRPDRSAVLDADRIRPDLSAASVLGAAMASVCCVKKSARVGQLARRVPDGWFGQFRTPFTSRSMIPAFTFTAMIFARGV